MQHDIKLAAGVVAGNKNVKKKNPLSKKLKQINLKLIMNKYKVVHMGMI